MSNQTADLVTRLRDRAGKYDEYDWHGDIELEAASEIERLRRDLEIQKVNAKTVIDLQDELASERAARAATGAALAELAKHTFDAQCCWLDHAKECKASLLNQLTCTCGLVNWLWDHRDALSAAVDVGDKP